ncbi:MAG: NAD(P)/FAD-dependent oxidoreductase [Sphingobacteriaceae bacterium]
MNRFDAVIIGGGACGLMCAVQAGYLGKKTLILERNDRVGAKILISGGGRCNYTNLYTEAENFISENPHFCKSAFSQWTVSDTINFFETYGIEGAEKTLGQLFPSSNKAKDIVAIFENLCTELGQEIQLEAEVKEVKQSPEGFDIIYSHYGKLLTIKAPKVVLASGGLPIAKLGASDFSLKTAKSFGMRLTETAPALVPLTITGKDADWYAQLSGNSVYCEVSTGEISFKENILFTHWGLSGPAILQISTYWRPGQTIELNLLPEENVLDLIVQERVHNGKQNLRSFIANLYTKKLSDAFGKFLPLDTNLASLTKADLESIEQFIHHFTIKPAGDKGYDKAEVMRGGISTDELSSKTLEAKTVPGLFAGGECVDVTGWLGGYNFQWAWASGYVIAQNI